MNTLFVGASIVYAALCMVPAAMKLTGTTKMRSAAAHFGIPWNRYQIIGCCEAAASAGVLAGLYWRPAGLLAALGMTALLVGALLYHRKADDELGEYISGSAYLAASVAYLGIWITQ